MVTSGEKHRHWQRMKKLTILSLLFGFTVTGLLAEDSPTVKLPSTAPATAPAASADSSAAPAGKKHTKKHHKKKKPAGTTTSSAARPKS
jgi:hypothetical protein